MCHSELIEREGFGEFCSFHLVTLANQFGEAALIEASSKQVSAPFGLFDRTATSRRLIVRGQLVDVGLAKQVSVLTRCQDVYFVVSGHGQQAADAGEVCRFFDIFRQDAGTVGAKPSHASFTDVSIIGVDEDDRNPRFFENMCEFLNPVLGSCNQHALRVRIGKAKVAGQRC